MYIAYVTLSIKIRREHARKTEIHDNDDENKQTEDDGEEIL